MLLLALTVQFTFAQEKTISGTVSDETGPLPGVNVIVKGTNNGTQTDFDGNYTLKVNTGAILVFSYVGMETVEKTVGSSSILDVQLDGFNLLEEVVVTAYGTQKKESLTGSITEIKSEEFAKVPSGNAVTGLTGKVAGVQIYSNSGQPGAAPTVRFRGIGSLNGSSNPLYVVDGTPFSESITTINPNDIESMSFVKDASAAALYGSRGANGVIIITTKKGSQNKTTVTLDVKTTFTDRAVEDYGVLTNSGDYFEAYHKMLKNNEIVGGATVEDAGIKASTELLDGPLGLVYNPYGGDRTNLVDPVTGKFRGGTALWQDDWRDYLFENSSGIQNYYLSFSGGSEKTKYFVSAGYEDQKGYNINTGFNRTTVNTNVESEVVKNLKVGVKLNYSNREQKGTLTNNITGNFAWARNIAPIYPVYARDHATGAIFNNSVGDPNWDWAGIASPNAVAGRPFNGFSNPHALQSLNVNKSTRDNFSGKAFAKYIFLEDFEFSYTFAYDLASYNATDYTNKIVGSAVDVGGRLSEEFGRGTTLTNQQLLTWKKTLGDSHHLNILGGHESSKYDFKYLNANQKNQFLNGDLSPILFAQPDGSDSILGDYSEYDLEGYFARAMYDFGSKYFINGSFRRDGSSVFHPDNRWGNFWGAGVAWQMTRESFMENADWLNNLKLKASMGQQGNDIVYYPNSNPLARNYAPYLDQWSVTADGEGGFNVTKEFLGNKDLTWETSNNFNVGFEAAFLDNSIIFEAEYFVRKIDDLIFNRPLPSSTGLPSVPENVMDMQNKGIELLLSFQILRKEDLNWTFDINATSYKNEITKLVPGKDFIDSGRYRWTVGGGAYDYFMRDFVGVNPENGNALWATDIELDPITDEPTNGVTETYSVATEYVSGKTALPDVFGGFSTNFDYKNFDFGLDFSFQWGGYSYDEIYNDGFDGAIGQNFSTDFDQAWTWDNTTASLPRITEDNNNWNQFSDIFLEKSDYLSLNNISIGYTLPDNVLDKVALSKLRIYGNINNIGLWTASNRKGFDPRQRVTGGTNAVRYASLKGYTIGVTLNF